MPGVKCRLSFPAKVFVKESSLSFLIWLQSILLYLLKGYIYAPRGLRLVEWPGHFLGHSFIVFGPKSLTVGLWVTTRDRNFGVANILNRSLLVCLIGNDHTIGFHCLKCSVLNHVIWEDLPSSQFDLHNSLFWNVGRFYALLHFP